MMLKAILVSFLDLTGWRHVRTEVVSGNNHSIFKLHGEYRGPCDYR